MVQGEGKVQKFDAWHFQLLRGTKRFFKPYNQSMLWDIGIWTPWFQDSSFKFISWTSCRLRMVDKLCENKQINKHQQTNKQMVRM